MVGEFFLVVVAYAAREEASFSRVARYSESSLCSREWKTTGGRGLLGERRGEPKKDPRYTWAFSLAAPSLPTNVTCGRKQESCLQPSDRGSYCRVLLFQRGQFLLYLMSYLSILTEWRGHEITKHE